MQKTHQAHLLVPFMTPALLLSFHWSTEKHHGSPGPTAPRSIWADSVWRWKALISLIPEHGSVFRDTPPVTAGQGRRDLVTLGTHAVAYRLYLQSTIFRDRYFS